MGIDVYLEWKGKTEADTQAQYTGFSTTHGHVGYLREAYHGGPYATAYLISEDWNDQPEQGFEIKASTLRKRLPAAVMASIYRENVVYGGDQAQAESLQAALTKIFGDVPNIQRRDFTPNKEQVRACGALIKKRKLPPYALAFVDFVDLAERKEKETGNPCRVVVSA